MALTPGTRLGIYEITAAIGEGGMGQVYRARDTKLDRDVAIKVLPEAFADDPDRLARFQREAKTLASLNHPNIAHIHGLEESAGIRALVMELVEGDDLAQRIARGPLPLDEALPIAKQIADALEAAHEQGIIHRDLKPANIKVRDDGTVKVLDFGLAKAMDVGSGGSGGAGGAGGPGGLSMSPTITTPAMTQAGMILGTAAYMSPEQARGKAVDRRADIWAFGAVLFEMLTGERAFGDEGVSMTLSRVLQREPEYDLLPSTVPARVTQALHVCLRKDPKQRVGDIRDVRLMLEGAFETVVPQSTAVSTRPTSAARALPWAVAGAFAAAAFALLLLWAPWHAQTSVDAPLVRLDVDLGADVSLPTPTFVGSSVAISPDGTRLVYASGTPPRLFIRRFDQAKATELPGTQGATSGFFSPDGQWVGFVSGVRVNKISVQGGAVVPLVDVAPVVRATWSGDGSVLVAGRKLLRFPAGGGAPETVAEVRNGELGLGNAEILPGGKAVLLAADNPGPVDRTTIDVVTLADHQRTTVVRGGSSPRYLPSSNGTGHLIYVSGSTLFAIPFDLRTLTTLGTAVPLIDDVAHEANQGVGQFDVSRTGTVVYRKAIGGAFASTRLQWVDIEGKKEPLRAKPGAYRDLSLSPDGKRIALGIIDAGNQDVWVFEPEQERMTRLTFGGEQYRFPMWSPDGRYVVFAAVGRGIFQSRADGASQPLALIENTTLLYPRSFTPDGKWLAFSEAQGPEPSQLWTARVNDQSGRLSAGAQERFLKSSSTDALPSFSADGRWLAYQSNESGTPEVYVRPFPQPASGPGSKWQISNSGGTAPHWSRSGRDVLYRSGDQIMAASYTVRGDRFAADKPRVWIAKTGVVETGNPAESVWDLAPDGRRALVLTPLGSEDAPKQEHEVVFLQNFVDELRRRVPLGK